MPTPRSTGRPAALALATAVASSLLLGACAATTSPVADARRDAPMTADQFASLKTALNQSPQVRGKLGRDCADRLRANPLDTRENMAALLDVDTDKVEAAFCDRMLDSVARGDIGYEDWAAMERRDTRPDVMRRLFRALRREPGERMI